MKTRKMLSMILALVMSLSVMLPCFSAFAVEATDSTATAAPYPTQYPALSTDLVSGTTTFTVAEIAEAAKTVVSHYDTYKALETNYSIPKAVTVGTATIAEEDWAYMAAFALNGLSGAYSLSGLSGYTATTTVVYKDVTKPNVTAHTQYTGETYTLAQVAEASYKVANYVNGSGNGAIAASCGSVATLPAPRQISYYTILLATARALAAYATEGTLPTTVANDVLSYVTTDSDTYVEPPVVVETEAPATVDPNATPEPTLVPPAELPLYEPLSTDLVHGESTFTVAEIAAAAQDIIDQYESYSDNYGEYSIAKSVAVGNSVVSDQDWFYMAANAIAGLSGAYAASGLSGYGAETAITYTTVGAPTANANTDATATEVTLAKVAEIAWKIAAYSTTNNGYLAASCGSAIDGQVSYYSAVMLAARTLNAYDTTGALPETVALDKVNYFMTDTDMAPAVIPVPTVAPATQAPATEAPIVTVEPTVNVPATTPTYEALSTDLVSGTTTFTVAEIAAAAQAIVDQYAAYAEYSTEYSIAKTVKVGNSVVSDQDWAYMAGYAIAGLNGTWTASGLSGYTAETAVTYKTMGKAENLAYNGIYDPTVTIDKVAEIAWKNMSNYGNQNGKVSSTCGSALPGQVSYYSALLLEARALAAYAADGVLPTTVAFDALTYNPEDTDIALENIPVVTQAPATAAPTENVPEVIPTYPAETEVAEGATFTVAQIAQAAQAIVDQYAGYAEYGVKYSVAQYVTVGESVIGSEDWFYMAAYAINGLTGAYAASGLTGYTADTAVAYKNVLIPNVPANNGVFDATVEAAKVAEITWKIATYEAQNNGALAASCGSALSGQVSYYGALMLAARALAAYTADGTIPATVAFDQLNYVLPEGAPTAAPATQAPATEAPTQAVPETTPSNPAETEVATGTTFTVAQIAAAAQAIVDQYTAYATYGTEYSIAKTVAVGESAIGTEDWFYIAAYAINGLTGAWEASGLTGYTADTTVAYKNVLVPNKDANNGAAVETVEAAKVAEITWKIATFEAGNNGALAASCGTAISGQVSYNSALMLAARALAAYAANGTVPATVAFDKLGYVAPEVVETQAPATQAPATAEPTVAPTAAPTVAPTAEPTEAPSKTYKKDSLLYTGNALNNYFTRNNTLPAFTTMDGAKLYMPEVIGAFAQLIVDANNGSTATTVAGNDITENETIYEQLTAGTFTKAQYVALAEAVLAFEAENGVAPGYLTTDLGAMSMNTIIVTFAKAIATLRSTKALPASVEVTAWPEILPVPPEEHATEFAYDSVLYAANSINTYVNRNNKYPRYATIDGEEVYTAELIGVFAQLIVNANAGNKGMVARNDATFAENSYEALTGTTLTKAQYVQAAQDVLNYIATSPSAAAPGYITTAIGTLSNETLIKVFASVGATLRSTKALPETVEVTAWAGAALPTPPEPTPVPVYDNLDFKNTVKGARRVLTTINEVQTIPTFVTLALEDGSLVKVYPGTMLRLFAATVSNINRGKTANMPLQEVATPKNLASETIVEGTLTKTQYIALAQRIASAIYANGAVPTYISTDLGQMNHYNMIYLFTRVLDFYLTYGFLPDTMDVQPWDTVF